MEWGEKAKHEYAKKLINTPIFMEFLEKKQLEISKKEYKNLSDECIKYLQNELGETIPNSYNGYVAWLSLWKKCFRHAAETAGIIVK
jgi:hypothetical protein